MLDKGGIIQKILLKLGNTRSYNNDMSKEYQVCSNIYENEIKDMKINNRFLFNAITVDLNYANRTPDNNGEYKYNLPIGFLNLVSVSGEARQEGDFIYSSTKDLQMTFCRDIPNNDVPDYIEPYLTGRVGVEMCLAYSQYQDKIQIFQQMANEEMLAVNRTEISTTRNYMSQILANRPGTQNRKIHE